MSRSQRRWHLFAWLAIVPLAICVLLFAWAQRGTHGGIRTPQLPQEPR